MKKRKVKQRKKKEKRKSNMWGALTCWKKNRRAKWPLTTKQRRSVRLAEKKGAIRPLSFLLT
jgi:hypothetical protein